jgi:hypothetical protein
MHGKPHDCEIGDDVPTHPAPEVPPPACNVRNDHCFPKAPLVIQGVLWKSGVPSDGSKNVLFLNVETDATNNLLLERPVVNDLQSYGSLFT